MVTPSFPHLKWALAKNTNNLWNLLLNIYRDKHNYLKYLDNLIYFLRQHSCGNIQEKLSYIADLDRFISTQSELEIAKALLERGKSVDLIPENYMNMVSPPDLLVVDNRTEAYVEVKRIKEDETINIIIEFLRKFLLDKDYPCIVNVHLNEKMSIPAIEWDERRLKEESIRKAFKKFEEEIKTVNLSLLPREIETNIGTFEIYQSDSGKGFPGVITTFATIPEEKLVDKIRHDVIEKASKRNKWTNAHRNKIFIVALDFEELSYDENSLKTALIGYTVYVMPSLPMPIICETEEVRHAKERGWETFLYETYILPHNRIYLDNNRRGIFFTEPIVKNISGVIGRFRERLYFIPNPFSYDEINDPSLVNYLKNS